jgi:predicted MFS family arabinose efflux permease
MIAVAEIHQGGRRRTPIWALLASDGISRVGNAVTNVAVPLLALQLGGPLATAATGVAATLPLALGGVLGGVVVDRLGFRRASLLADAMSGVTVVSVPVLASLNALSLWALALLVFASNLLDVPGEAARSSQIPELADLAHSTLERIAAAHATISRTALMIGAGVAGLLVATVGAAPALFVDAASFAVAIMLTVTLVPRVGLAAGEAPDGAGLDGAGVTAGLRFLWRAPLVRAIVGMVVVTNAIDAAGMLVLKPLYAARLGDDGSALGLLVAVFAGGALVGAALYGVVGGRLPRRVLYVTLFLLAGAPPYVAMAISAPFPMVVIVIALSGLAAGPLNPLIDSVLYRLIPPGIRARALGTISAGVAAAMPLGSALAGVAQSAFGLTITLSIAAGAYLATILLTAFGRRWRGF